MHLVSASSSRASVQSDGGLSWSNQLGKSVVLAASSVGLGWLISRLWQGVDEPPIIQTGNSGQLTIYKETQNNSHWSTVVTSYAEQGERYEQEFGSETLFQKIDITYRASVQERSSITTMSNYHVLSACSLVGGLLMGGNIQLPLMVPLLALSMSKSVEALNYGDDVPVGTVIAYASKKLPEGYLRCDGSVHSKNDYPELYDALGEEYRVGGGSFRVPDFEGLFLRGTNDVSEIGKKFEDTTRMPRNNPFKTKDSGEHVHTTHSSGLHEHNSGLAGEHDHTSALAGEHSHIIDKAGEHSHSVSVAGDHRHTVLKSGSHVHPIHSAGHTHSIRNAGKHNHAMRDGGQHNHINGNFNRLMTADGQSTSNGGSIDNTGPADEPNLFRSDVIRADGLHAHYIHEDGEHSHVLEGEGSHKHGMDQSGDHSHGIHESGAHVHTLNTVGSHTHKISSVASHSHTINSAGEHVHKIAESGGHVHEIRSGGAHTHEVVGGDAETSPKNSKVAYLIKAKRSENGSTAGTSTDGLITSQSVVLSLVTATFAFFAARMGR